MKAAELMTREGPTVSPTTSVGEIVRLLLDTHVDGLPVLDGGRLVGLIQPRDVVAKHARPHVPVYLGILGYVLPFESESRDDEVRRVLAVTAADLMNDQPAMVAPDADIDDVATLMVDEAADAVPVVHDGRLLGMIGQTAILQLLRTEEGDDGASAGE